MGIGFGGATGLFGIGGKVFGVIFCLSFLLIDGIFVVIAVKGIGEWSRNNSAPRLTVPATVIAKRTNVSRHHHHNGTGMHYNTYATTYYVTFQVESGDRMELCVPGNEFGVLLEGDCGDLTFQGTRYLEFERE